MTLHHDRGVRIEPNVHRAYMIPYAQAYSKTHRDFGTGSFVIRATRHIHGKTSVAERAAPAAAYRRGGNPRRQATAAQISAPKGAHTAPSRSANKAARIAMREPKASQGDHVNSPRSANSAPASAKADPYMMQDAMSFIALPRPFAPRLAPH